MDCIGFSGWAVCDSTDSAVFIYKLFENLNEAIGHIEMIYNEDPSLIGNWDMYISEFNYIP